MESVNDTKRRIREKVRMETQKREISREIKNRRLKGRHALMEKPCDQLSLGICGGEHACAPWYIHAVHKKYRP